MDKTLDTLTDEDTQIAEVESRLVDEFGTEARETVHTAVEEERTKFADASVHAFVPILVERSVRSRLDDENDENHEEEG
jgi:hypothetical protein